MFLSRHLYAVKARCLGNKVRFTFTTWSVIQRNLDINTFCATKDIQDVSEVMVKNLRMKTTKMPQVNMGPQMNRLRDIAYFVLRSGTDLFIRMLISSFSPVPWSETE
jgi:hypothetical protein